MNKHIIIIVVVLGIIGFVSWKGGSSDMAPPHTSAVAVRTSFVTPETIAAQLNTLGTTEALMDVELTTKTTGKVSAIHFVANQSVKTGDLLLELESATEQAAVQEARVTLAEDQRVLAHYEKLFKTRAVSQTVMDEQKAKVAASDARLAAAEAVLSEMFIRAPFDGVLGFREVSLGTLIEPGDRITTLDAIDILKLEFTAPEYWIGKIRIGDSLSATSIAYPGKVFKARVEAVGNRVDPVTRAIVMKARLDNSKRLLRPGMSLDVILEGPARESLVISEEALLQQGKKRFVYLVTAGNKVETREVETGVRRNNSVEILTGLAAGDQIIREGVQKIRPGSKVNILADEAAP